MKKKPSKKFCITWEIANSTCKGKSLLIQGGVYEIYCNTDLKFRVLAAHKELEKYVNSTKKFESLKEAKAYCQDRESRIKKKLDRETKKKESKK